MAAAAATAATAALMYLQGKWAEHRHPPFGRFMEVDGVRLHYIDIGQGQPLVLLHGNGSMIHDFALSGLIDRAATRYRVIAFDRPGFGYSTRPRDREWDPHSQAVLIRRALQRLGVEQPIVAGHSWGTMVTLALGLLFPRDIAALVLLSGYYHPSIRLDVPIMAAPAIPVLGDLMRYTISPIFGWLIWPGIKYKLFAPAPVASSFEAFPTSMTMRPWQIRAAAAETGLMIPAAAELQARYGELKMPVVIAAGTGDKFIDTEYQSARLHKEIPHSVFRPVPGVGHMVHHTAPGAVMAAIDLAARQVREHKGLRNDTTPIASKAAA